jgi:hypothetical protein
MSLRKRGDEKIRLPKMPNHYTFTLKMANEVFVEALDNYKHLTRLTPESRSYILNSSCENLRVRIIIICCELISVSVLQCHQTFSYWVASF